MIKIKVLLTFASEYSSVVCVDMFDFEGFFASPVSIPHVVNLLSVLAPLDDGGRVASDGAHDLDVLPDPPNLFHFLFVGLRRT